MYLHIEKDFYLSKKVKEKKTYTNIEYLLNIIEFFFSI